MVKNRTPPGQHKHCDKCHDLRCHVAVEISVSCVVVKCARHCGAAFHLCKEEEHQLLCPNEKVPCLNAGYGCPLTLLRHRRAKHLEVCPASVVSCSQDWNRWPVGDGDSVFHTHVPIEPQSEGPLDLCLALRDQDLLFRSIKMKNIFPELMEVLPEEAGLLDVAAGGVGVAEGHVPSSQDERSENGMEVPELSQEEREALAKNRDLDSMQKFSTWEGMFKKEMQGCKETCCGVETGHERGGLKGREDRGKSPAGRGSSEVPTRVNGGTGFAPWEDGVLERLSKEVDLAEFNMYVAHNGAMLINFGQLAACTPRDRDFVYGNLEPIEVQTVRTYNVPVSYRARRDLMKDPSQRRKTAQVAVDTADLGAASGGFPTSDEVVGATLLCSLEKELRGHAISESVGTDGLYVDVGTQTYDFASVPFKAEASLADVTAHQPKGLYMQLQAESVTRRHNKSSSVFTYLCGHVFRRDEYHSHFRNVHCDIQSGLNGWFEQRCPLAYLGCNYSQRRFQPSDCKGTVTYNQNLDTFSLRPEVPLCLLEGQKGEPVSPERKRQRNLDPLSRLPNEVLRHMAGFLDSFTLSQLSQVSQLMREICATFVEERGMVSLNWERKTYSHGGSSWRCRKKVWTFSSLFSPVNSWRFDDDVPSISDHLKVCSFYEREERSEPVALAGIDEVRDTGERQGLVKMFPVDK